MSSTYFVHSLTGAFEFNKTVLISHCLIKGLPKLPATKKGERWGQTPCAEDQERGFTSTPHRATTLQNSKKR